MTVRDLLKMEICVDVVDDKEDYVVRGLKAQGYKIFPVEVIDRYWDNAPRGD